MRVRPWRRARHFLESPDRPCDDRRRDMTRATRDLVIGWSGSSPLTAARSWIRCCTCPLPRRRGSVPPCPHHPGASWSHSSAESPWASSWATVSPLFTGSPRRYIKLLQMTVLPYVTVSIIGGLGRLRLGEARALGTRTVPCWPRLWVTGTPLHVSDSARVSSHTEREFLQHDAGREARRRSTSSSLYIPSNPFRSLADNIVPAVVLFSVLVGIALITVERKHVVLDVLQRLRRGTRARRADDHPAHPSTGSSPLRRHAAGTMTLDQFGRLQIYIVIYVLMTLLIALWVLPGLIAALTQIPLRKVFAAATTPC